MRTWKINLKFKLGIADESHCHLLAGVGCPERIQQAAPAMTSQAPARLLATAVLAATLVHGPKSRKPTALSVPVTRVQTLNHKDPTFLS